MTTAPELTVENTWMADHSWSRPRWTVEQLVAAKRGRTISVVLPALNEEETVAGVVESIAPMLGGLVDELIVLDSGSTDAHWPTSSAQHCAISCTIAVS